MLVLNDTSVFLWNLLNEGATKETLLDKILSEYDIDRETAATDIDNFLDRLRKAGIFEE